MAPIPSEPTEAEKKFLGFFTALAEQDYAKQTGNTTRHIIAQVLDDIPLGINSYSVIHDNASGPGTATEALTAWNEARAVLPSTIEATDSTPAMIDALKDLKMKRGWERVTPKVMDSHRLDFPNEHFSHIICNFSIFTFRDPLRCLFEMERTLRHTGIAIITCWKRFGVSNVIDAAQKSIRPDSESMPVASPEFFREGFLATLVEAAGWERGKIKTLEKSHVVKEGKELDNIIEFMSGQFTAPARAGWSDEEIAKWPGAIKDAVEEEKKQHGGILLEAWVVLMRKWDKMSA